MVKLQFVIEYVTNLPVFFTIASLTLGQSYDFLSAGEVILKDMATIDRSDAQYIKPDQPCSVHNPDSKGPRSDVD